MKSRCNPPESYNVVWRGQSKNSGESMPLGGHDVGCNVWAENGSLLIYFAQSGAFDGAGRMCKAGRLRIAFAPGLSAEDYVQTLRLAQGEILITGKCGNAGVRVLLWADALHSAVSVRMDASAPVKAECCWETWRSGDTVELRDESILAYHCSEKPSVFEERVAEQGIESIAEYFPDVERNRIFGALLLADGMESDGVCRGKYAENDFTGYRLRMPRAARHFDLLIALRTEQAKSRKEWVSQLRGEAEALSENTAQRRADTLAWWSGFWARSYVQVKPGADDPDDKDWQVGRNYQLFRYLLGCNACGEYPTKFNGGLFTVDPLNCSRREGFGSVTPDDRDWGGLIFTAQNQRLVYWPMLRNGDFDLMAPQFRFYARILPGVKKRTEFFFGLKDAACFPEQLDANGLSAFYGKYGLDYPLQVRYHYVDGVEFSCMMLRWHEACGGDLTPYLDFIAAVLRFYDVSYAELDSRGKRVIYPSTALETFHAAQNINLWGRAGAEAADYCPEHVAVKNPADVIAALTDTLGLLLQTEYGTAEQRAAWRKLLGELPPIPTERKNGYRVIAPCEEPKKYEITNCELPQLYTVFPYHIYGLTKPDLQLARDTYLRAWQIPDQLLHISWHQNGIFAARLGLKEEARRYLWLKLCDSPRRFPAFWGPGHDYVPDHNWGGSGMLGAQEMLMQCSGGKIYLLPAWPKDVDVSFRLWADDRSTCVTADYAGGKLKYQVEPAERAADVTVPDFC